MQEGAGGIGRRMLWNQSEAYAKAETIAQLLFIEAGKRANQQKYVCEAEPLQRSNEKDDERLAAHVEEYWDVTHEIANRFYYMRTNGTKRSNRVPALV